MPENSSKPVFLRFPILSSLFVLCILLFLSIFFVLGGNYSVDTQTIFAVVSILGAMGAALFWMLIKDKSKTREDLSQEKLKNKEVWKILFNGQNPRTPLVTYTLLAVLAFFFVPVGLLFLGSVEKAMGFLALGASSRDMVFGKGEWYRLFTAVLLHAGFVHFASNAIALFMAGKIFEQLAGRYWLLVTFTLSGVGGTLMSIVVNSHSMPTVGASGAIMGLMGATYVLTFRLKESKERKGFQRNLLQALAFNILPFIWSHAGGGIDYGGHLGGALVGMALGLFLYAIWDKDAPNTRWNGLGQALAYGGIGIYLLAVIMAVVDALHTLH